MSKRALHLCTLAVVSAAAAVAGAAAFGAGTHAAPAGRTPPIPPASSFNAHVDNQWFPLEAGTRYVYTGVKDGKPSRDVLTVTHQTKIIDGVPCVVVQDRLYLRGRLGERTTDWYTQDKQGNVWYFGENTTELDGHGHVTSTSGSWTAGVDGARPGIYMPANPRVGQSGRQEFYKGEAEDQFEVIGVFRTVTAAGTENALLTQETTPLEPGTVDHKMYVRSIGTVLEQTERGGNERNELISVTRAHDRSRPSERHSEAPPAHSTASPSSEVRSSMSSARIPPGRRLRRSSCSRGSKSIGCLSSDPGLLPLLPRLLDQPLRDVRWHLLVA